MKILFTLESSAGMEVKVKQIKGGVTAAKGFKAASTAAGIPAGLLNDVRY